MTADRRFTLARPDLAAADLEGLVRAERFAKPTSMVVVAPAAPIRASPGADGEQVDQLLFGERFDVLDAKGPVAWGRARRDGYVGWVETAALSAELCVPTHWVSAPRAFAFAEPGLKSKAAGPFSLNALVTITETTDTMVRALGAGWMARAHISPIGRHFADPAMVAMTFLGAPYLWGGRDSLGLDCSGLVQQALYACDQAAPRDADQQARLGVEVGADRPRRGDLVCWRGHIGIMLDARRLLHANAHHMAVAIEPLREAIERIRAGQGQEPFTWRRL